MYQDYYAYPLRPIGSALLQVIDASEAKADRVVAVAYPSAHDKVISRAYILGDKSLFLKYLNPNMAVVVTESVDLSGSSVDIDVNASSTEEYNGVLKRLTVSVIDTVTGNVIYRYLIPNGGGGVGMVKAEIIEHNVIVTYWNNKAQRTELSSLTLYEGMVSKTGLGPMTSLQSPASVSISSFTSPQPIGLQKTFILPKAVESKN